MAKIERKYLAHYIAATDGNYERLGEDLEEFSPEMNAKVETRQNILGQTTVIISGYEKTAQVESYFAKEGTALFEKLQAIIDGDLALDDLKVAVVEVKLWDGEGPVFPAVQEQAYVEVVSYGGNCDGYQIPFKLHYTGEKTKGSFNVSGKTFTAE